MKAILTIGVVWGLLMIFANTDVTAQEEIRDVAVQAEQEAKNIDTCTQNLIDIGKSIQIYLKEKGDYPEWLSDLHHPKYLPYPDILICPSDEDGGKAVFSGNVDPNMPVSYGYQLHPGYRGARITDRRLLYGDVIPLVRCRHHTNIEFECLNLSFAYKITRSTGAWESQPEQLYETEEEAVTALEAGLQRQPDAASLSRYVYPTLARLYIKTGREGDVDKLITQLKSILDPDDVSGYLELADILEMLNRDEEVLQMLTALEKKHPNHRSIHQELAEIHWKLGNIDKAKEYQRKAQMPPVVPAMPLVPAVPIGAERPQEEIRDVVAQVEQEAKNIDTCTQNLIDIGKSIQIYLKEKGDYPEWLSDLHHPKYLPYPDILICPSDENGGKAVFSGNVDPNMPVSYGYQLHPGYRGARITDRRLLYGDVIPLVRCRHHTNIEFECLNLSFAYKITRSTGVWESQPEQLYETEEEAVTTLEAGLQRQPDAASLSRYVYPTLARLYIKTGREGDVDSLITQLKSILDPDDISGYLALADILEMLNRDEERLQMLTALEKKHPNHRSVHQELAEIHWKLGNIDKAKEYQRKAQMPPVVPAMPLVPAVPIGAERPKAEQVTVMVGAERPKAEQVTVRIGQPVPDFSATDLDGNPISLEDYRGKVVLLDFWAVWCGPCIAEMPNIQRVYERYKDEGFDIIGISLDTDETRLRNYLKENAITWRQVFSGKGWQSPISQQYGIRGIPAPWLIARDGTLISPNARGKALAELVAEALKDTSETDKSSEQKRDKE